MEGRVPRAPIIEQDVRPEQPQQLANARARAKRHKDHGFEGFAGDERAADIAPPLACL